MTYHSTLKVAAVVTGVFGLMMVLAPNKLMALYGSQPLTGSGLYNTTLLGVAFLSYTVMNWLASNVRHYEEIRIVILGNVIVTVLGFFASIIRQLTSPDAVPMGWLNVVLYLGFGLLFASILFGEHRASADSKPTLRH